MHGAPGEIRTPYPLVRSQVLYPDELRARRGRNYTQVSPPTQGHQAIMFGLAQQCINRPEIMEAEQLNSLANHLEDLAERANELRRYL